MGGPSNLREPFERQTAMTVGLEEELMILDGETLDLAPRAPELLALVDGDPRFKQEMPAAQIEIAVPPTATPGEGAAALLAARRELAAAAETLGLRLAGGGVHPFAHGDGALNVGERYEAIAAEFGAIARRQLCFGLHVHVAVPGADCALAVYNALRGYLPEIAALGAGAPFYEGADMGLASVRPMVADLLPRQGVPPVISSWETFATEMAWGAASGRVPDPSQWWWEARLHLVWGTIEVRVPDAQPTARESGAIAAVVHCLVARLAERHAAGEQLGAPPSWRIGENRWAACRHGTAGEMVDLRTGETRTTRQALGLLLHEIGPTAQRLGCVDALADARVLAARNAADRLREIAGERGVPACVDWLAGRFLDG